MSHRVLLDFTCPSNLISGATPAYANRIRHLLAEHGWESAKGREAGQMFQRMAAQLPEEDLPSFVRNTKAQMWRKSPHAELTLGHFVDEDVGKVRVRIRADNNAVIAELGKRTASELLALPELQLTHMDLFESRDGQSLLQGHQIVPEKYRFWDGDNLPVALPLAFSVLALLAGAMFVTISFQNETRHQILGDPIWEWYGRLFGPLLMAVITTGAVVVRDARRTTLARHAEWDI